MRGVQESTPHELYLRSALASKVNAPLKLYADIAGKFTVGRELNGKAESRVQQSTADAKKTKTERRIVLLDNPPTLTSSTTKTKSSAPAKKRKPVVSAPIAATVKRVPIRVKNEGSSAARGPSPPHSLPSSQSSPLPPAIRAQMIHLIAKGPRTKEDVLAQVGGPDASETLRVQLNELLVTVRTFSKPYFHFLNFNSISQIAERERTKTSAGQPLYTLLPVSWKEVRPYEFAGLTDDERRKMWRQARQFLYTLGIPEADPAWDHVRTQPGSTGTGSAKAAAGTKRATGTVNAERKKNTGSSSKPLVEAKDEGVRPSQTAKVREESIQASRSVKAVDNPPPRRPPGVSGPKNARDVAPTQSQPQQAQGPSKKTGHNDARAKPSGSSKLNGRSGPATHISAPSTHERELERTHPTKKEREDANDLDREKGKAAAVHKVKRRKDDTSDLDSLRDWDGADTMGKGNAKRKKLREDYDDKDRVNGTGNAVKRRKVLDDDKPYKPGGGGGGGTKARERDRDKELDRGKTGDRDPPHVAKRPRDSDRGSPDPPPPPRKSAVRERERQRERDPDRSLSPPRRVKREYSMSPALHNSHQRENSPLPRAATKRADSPPRHSVKRESSPRVRGHPRRDDSPLAPQTSSKRVASPSRPQNRPRERHRETSTSRRRRSPIYTSSEDEQQNLPVRRNAPSSVTSSSSSREAVRGTQGHTASHPLPPSMPYPKDRDALAARYRSGYRSYIAVYHKLLDERAKIQDALEGVGREGSVGSDRDVEMMDEEGLKELKGQYAAWTRELEGIRNAYSAEAERMDIKT